MKCGRVVALGSVALPLLIVACGGSDEADVLFAQAGAAGEMGGSGNTDASVGGSGTGGKAQGGAAGSSSGGSSNGGSSNGGSSNGGSSSGGSSNGGSSNGGSSNGGSSNGGSSTGGSSVGGSSTGGSSTGGSSTGGSSTGGSSTGGSSTGGSSTGGSSTGGSSTGGSSTGGSSTGGAAGCPLVHDEDSDQLDDACDNCPSIPNGGQANADGDGVGNLCEYPKDQGRLGRIQYFEPFVSKPASFEFGSHMSMGDDELLLQTELCGSACSDMAFWNQPLNDTYSVETSFTFDLMSFGYAGVAFARKQSGWWACLLSRPGTSTNRYLALWYYPGAGSIQKMAEASGVEDAGVQAGARRRITVHVSSTEAVCRFENDAGDTAQVSAPPPAGGDFNGMAGMRVYEANVRYQSFVVYSP